MKNKNILLTLLIISGLAFIMTGISYGYWTDDLKITGNAVFEFQVPIVIDIEKPLDETENPSEDCKEESLASCENETGLNFEIEYERDYEEESVEQYEQEKNESESHSNNNERIQ